ncbi:discoidin domain-containing protein [Streptomyces sp. H10-C2]|uniref:discoidin domain-containing protein n=1 Tax=unclassified Streptomyces TaxID=2593676 RepID=UPI0024BBB603|nr:MULTISPECIES: discoidin domain-containing protein [unclassified Streptomyces]MDJ0341906.1 discoidin domain-containing protein [Streptomyces sp. PH10-H1]MDJ0370340.1 discoidin domain-containing protein [Streptomyces sp. H10-C2]
MLLGGPVLRAAAAERAPDAAAGRTTSASTSSGGKAAGNINDGDQSTYWEGSGSALPQWAQLDLGRSRTVDQVTLKVPAGWSSRTQTLAVQGSADGTSYATIVGSAKYVFAPGSGNTVKIKFPAANPRFVRVEVTANTAKPAAQISELQVADAAAPTDNLAISKTLSASSSNSPYVAGNANDGNQASYWESANNAFPQWIQADLGAAVGVNQLVLKLPAGWGSRTQTLAVQGSANGSSFTDIVASKGYLFDPAAANTVTISFNATTTRYVRLNITANTGWPAGQLSELEVYGPTTGDTQPPTAPTGLAYTQPASGQIKLTWNASTDNVGVTGYDVYANNTLRTTVAGNVLTFTDSQPDTATVSYYVQARDAAGNQSGSSNTVTRTGTGGGGTNLAVGKAITASSTILNFVAANANDNNVATYWEANGGSYPNTLTVALGSNADVNSVVLKLNPDAAWSTRTQTIQVLGREQSSSSLTSLTSPTVYTFNPASGNTVTIPVSGRVADVQLKITSNSGAGGGQVAEFQVIGTPAPNPDLTVTGITASPASPVETDPVTLSATVKNIGPVAAGATNVTFYLGTTLVGTAPVAALAAGASATVSANIGVRDAGSYPLTAKVDEANAVIEQNEANNSFSSPTPLVVTPVASSDLIASPVSWTPGNPAAGNTVTFSVAIKNQGTIASASGAHGITLTVTDLTSGSVVKTLTGSSDGAIAAGGTASPVSLGTWTAGNGKYSVKTVLANDANELPVKQANNTSTQPLFVGRGANMPYDMYEAENGVLGGGAAVVGPNRTVGDLAGEASGRKAVTLNSTGSSVEFTTKASTNTLVTRFSIPDAPGGGGINSTLNVYVDGVFLKAIDLTSKHAWLYGAEAGPSNSPGAGGPRHIYDEGNLLLGTTVPAGHKIKLQKDAANTTTYAIDFINLEQTAPIANPDPAKYTVPAGFTQQDVQNALDKVRMDATGTLVGVYLPPGDYPTANKFQVYGKAVKLVGAGPWYTRFQAPATQENTDIGLAVQPTASGSTFSGFGYFGNYTDRVGDGKVFSIANVTNLTIDNLWTEHELCMYWGANTDNVTIKNSRIRDTFADGINMTNGSTNNLVSNNESRSTGDDSFALFAAIDNNNAQQTGNIFENLTSLLTWRAAGAAVYGGYDNIFRNMYIADTLTYSGVTISSLDFGIPMLGFGASPPTQFQNISIVRAGGHFWGGQTFPAIWVFSASKVFQGIRVSDVDIVDPTYSGIMFQTKYTGSTPENPVTDTVFTDITISGAQKSGDAFDAKSGFGIWANELPEPGQGPAVGSVTFNNLKMSNNFQNIKNTTSTFTIVQNP